MNEREEAPKLRLVAGDDDHTDDAPYKSWDDLYADNVVRIYRLLYGKVGNRHDAEDLTTEVFLAAFRPLRLTATRPEVRAYLGAASRTVLAGFWRRRLGVEVTSIDAAEAFVRDPGVDSGAGARAEAVLQELPDRHRRILELRFLEGRSIKEAATEMGITVTNAKVLQHRALKMAAGAGWKP